MKAQRATRLVLDDWYLVTQHPTNEVDRATDVLSRLVCVENLSGGGVRQWVLLSDHLMLGGAPCVPRVPVLIRWSATRRSGFAPHLPLPGCSDHLGGGSVAYGECGGTIQSATRPHKELVFDVATPSERVQLQQGCNGNIDNATDAAFRLVEPDVSVGCATACKAGALAS